MESPGHGVDERPTCREETTLATDTDWSMVNCDRDDYGRGEIMSGSRCTYLRQACGG